MTPPKPETLPPDLQDRKDKADVAKAEAEAAKAAADARAAEAAAQKAEGEAADRDAPSAREQRDATARKDIAVAEKEAAAARSAQLTELIPDLGAVKESTLEIEKGPPVMGSVLTFGALRNVAATIAKRILAKVDGGQHPAQLLVTAEVDLATSDAIYRDVVAGIEQLASAADRLLVLTAPATKLTLGVVELVTVVAGALPAVLSLLSAKRTLSTAEVTTTDLAATAAVAGALVAGSVKKPLTVFHDDFRLVPGGGVYKANQQLGTKRNDLVGRKLDLSDQRTRTEASLATAKAEEKALVQAIADAGKKPPADLEEKLATTRGTIIELGAKIADVGLRIGLIDSFTTSMDAFTAAVRAVPEGGRRSALATAALYELLHNEAQGVARFTHVLLVKSQAGQSQQLVENRPLWFKDKFSTAVDVNVSFMLLDTATSGILDADTATSTAKVYGKIGEAPNITVTPQG